MDQREDGPLAQAADEDRLWQQMWLAGAAGRRDREDGRLRLQEASGKRLAAILQTKVRTTMIGALAAFEGRFGRVWGLGLPEGRRTEAQRQAQQDWQACRQEILDLGNAQLRAAAAEVVQYDVKWNGASRLRLAALSGPDEGPGPTQDKGTPP